MKLYKGVLNLKAQIIKTILISEYNVYPIKKILFTFLKYLSPV